MFIYICTRIVITLSSGELNALEQNVFSSFKEAYIFCEDFKHIKSNHPEVAIFTKLSKEALTLSTKKGEK
jgi:hypothetical protein